MPPYPMYNNYITCMHLGIHVCITSCIPHVCMYTMGIVEYVDVL